MPPPSHSPPRYRSRRPAPAARTPPLARALDALPWLAAAGGVLGLALELTLRDGLPYVAALYYATPMPVVALASLIGGAVALFRRRRRGAICALVLVAAVCVQRTTAFVAGARDGATGGPTIRGVLWNVRHGAAGARAVVDHVRGWDPDVVVLVEPPRTADGESALDLAPLLPAYSVVAVQSKFVIAVRGRIEGARRVAVRGDARLAAVDVALDGGPLTLLCVDCPSSPLAPRGPSLAALARAVAAHADRPALLLGDFNTPRRSVHFAALRTRWTHAFEAAGDGPDMTWPEPLPVLALDHVWTSPSLRAVACRIARTRASDHRPVIFEVAPAARRE